MGEENEGLDFNSVIFRAYDIRGVFGEELTCEVAYEIARAIGTMARKKNQQNIILAVTEEYQAQNFIKF